MLMEHETAKRNSVVPVAADRREDRRHKVTAVAEVVEGNSGAKMLTKVGDLSRRGCFLETGTPFPVHSVTQVHIRKDKESFQAEARVVSASAGRGMGLQFTAIDVEQRHILSAWLRASFNSSWESSNRRRSQRILVRLPVRVSGTNRNGEPFEEDTQTETISAHGASLLVSTAMSVGQRLVLSNAPSKGPVECVVAHVGESRGDLSHIGVTFVLSNQYQLLWNAAFPLPAKPNAGEMIK
jgi:hypothetical protein